MKTTIFLAKALLVFIVVLVTSSLVPASDLVTLFGSGSSMLAFGPGIVSLDREYFNQIIGTVGDGKASPSYLRVEQTLSNTKSRYTFDIKSTGAEVATEKKLDRNDLFVVTHIGIYLIAQVSTTLGAEVLQTYPNTDVFVSATGFTPAHLEVIYNGFLEVKIGTKVNIPALPMQSFRFVPTSQQQAANNYILNSELNVHQHSYWPGILLWLHGTQNIEINIDFPALASMQIAGVASNTSNKIVFMPFGYVCKNAAKQL